MGQKLNYSSFEERRNVFSNYTSCSTEYSLNVQILTCISSSALSLYQCVDSLLLHCALSSEYIVDILVSRAISHRLSLSIGR